MRILLRDALRRLCAEIGWSYAVFWHTIRCGNSRHLVWLEGHYEPIRASTASDIVREWDALQTAGDGIDPLAELACLREDKVGDLVEKTMRSQVHVAGEGFVGRAAITGRHEWIVRGAESYNPEVAGEMNHQFSAGIMTTTVIPVLTHGVLQLGSIQTIRENLIFVEHVRQYFLQVGLPPRNNLDGDGVFSDKWTQLIGSNSLSRSVSHAELNREAISCSFQDSTSMLTVEEASGNEHFPFLAEEKSRKASSLSHIRECWPTSSCVRCSSGDDLFDVLGVDFKAKHSCGGLDSSPCAAQQDMNSLFDSLQDGIFSDSGPDQLLDAVVAKITAGAKQSSEEEHGSRSAITTGNSFNLPAPPSTGECSQAAAAYTSRISLWVDDGLNFRVDRVSAAAQGARPDDPGKSTRKRPRPGDGPRPRPKDRQMIQDRVKELREIVPNGAKCSIDALLERTIKHMLFLQSVTKHADMLKQTGEPKIMSKAGGLLLEDKFEGGATWAFEVGARPPVCPIIVEDLHPPRRLLVEMLCEERGFFLEIADLIRGLGLTILKGVMEARKDKVWARFAVEANRDVTRMDIFMSLVRLLEPTQGSSSSPVQGPENDNIACSAICQSSIPATGMADRLL